MNDQLHRYFLGLVAFGFVVTWAAAGALVALLAAAACAAIVFSPRLRRAVARQSRPKPTRRRTTPYELVPDDPSLIL